jgi:hypothetical protein
VYLAKLCRGYGCTDPKYPSLDYDKKTGECICIPHPCWNEKLCSPDLHPTFAFEESGKIQCNCTSHPHCDAVYIARDLCPGHQCETAEHPILDWDEEKKECMCRANPCLDHGGTKHVCDDEAHPVLRYREYISRSGETRVRCECGMQMRPLPGVGSAGKKLAEKIDLNDEL